jgi:hypothetical protein
MLIDTNNYQFWIMGLLWFSAPIISWLWSLVAIRRFKDLNKIVPSMADQLKETIKVLEDTKKMYELAGSERLESQKLKSVAEEELKAASAYYKKIEGLLKDINKDVLK